MPSKLLTALLILAMAAFVSCSRVDESASSKPDTSEKGDKKGKHDKDKDKDKDRDKDKGDEKDAGNSAPPAQTETAATGCDDSLWKRVYNPTRLEVIEQCKTVTGTIQERSSDEDGDEHMLLKLDEGQDSLLTKQNKKKKDGALVIEAVCVNPPTLKKVGPTCQGFTNAVQLPKVGDHVRVTGSYVTDGHNGWTEIHPITRIDPVG